MLWKPDAMRALHTKVLVVKGVGSQSSSDAQLLLDRMHLAAAAFESHWCLSGPLCRRRQEPFSGLQRWAEYRRAAIRQCGFMQMQHYQTSTVPMSLNACRAPQLRASFWLILHNLRLKDDSTMVGLLECWFGIDRSSDRPRYKCLDSTQGNFYRRFSCLNCGAG